MISDEDVRQFFQNKLTSPGEYGGPGSLQIYRGKPAHLWKDAPAGGCTRHFTVFEKFGVIPKYCFDCYKVLITPRTVVELFKLLMIFEKFTFPNDNTRKCMAEGRDDCSGTYKGFVYCRGMEEGKEVRKIIRGVVSEDISHKVSVTLKRGCSEYLRVYPEYAKIKSGAVIMKYRKDWQAHEDSVDKDFVFDTNASEAYADSNTIIFQREIFAMHYWLRYAATIGDISYLKIAGRTVPPMPNLKRPPFTVTTPLARHK